MQVSSIPQKQTITVFTDGSCHNQLKTGGWASIILVDKQKIILEGSEPGTTHQRMELIAVLESLLYIERSNQLDHPIIVYSDSQYVVDLTQRRERLTSSGFRTKKQNPIRNADLVQRLMNFMSLPQITFLKLKSHLKSSDAETLLNGEVDRRSRQMMRKHM